MSNLLVSLYSLLFLNSFFKILPLSAENQPIAISLAFLFSLLYFLYSNKKNSLIFISKYNLYLILVPPVFTFFIFGINNYLASFYSLLAYFQIPLYLFSTIYLFSRLENRKNFIAWFFKWFYLLIPFSFILNLQGIEISGLSGGRNSLGRGGGYPLYAPEPSALVGLSISLTTLIIIMTQLNLNDLYGVKKNRIIICFLFIIFVSKSASVYIYSIGLFIIYFFYKRLINVFTIKLTKKNKKYLAIGVTSFISILILIVLFPKIANYFLNFRPIYIIIDLFKYGLPKLFVHASYRPSFAFASFLPDSIINLFFGHGLDNWYGNYLDKTYEAATILGQNTARFSILLNENRLMSIRPPTVLGFIFYSYGLIGIFVILKIIFNFWQSKKLLFFNRSERKSLTGLFFLLFIFTSLIPTLAFNPLLFSIFPFSVIATYYYYEKIK